MKKDIQAQLDELTSELWSIGNMASDLETDLMTDEITAQDAEEKFEEVIEELRRLVEMFKSPLP